MSSRMCVCFACKENVVKDEAIKYNSHYYHSVCYSVILAKEQFYRVVCDTFHLKSPGPKIYKQARDLIASGLDYVGMTRAFKYIYEVKHTPVPKDKFDDHISLGLIPLYVKEAEDYWDKQEQQQQKIAASMAEAIEKEKETKQVVTINRPKVKQQVQLLSISEPDEEY